MKILITVLLVLVGIVVLALIVALFTRKEYSMEREVVINRPKQEVFSYIRMLKNQDNYNKWVMADPTMKKDFKGTDGTVGFVYAWDGNKEARKGEQQITNIREGESVDVDIHFIRPFEGIANTQMATEAVTGEQTKVKWRFHSGMKYPMNIMLLFLDMDKFLGKDIEKSLATLKGVLEK